MGIRQRKQNLLASLAFHLRASLISKEQHDAFEMMFRRCRNEGEQDEVRRVIQDQLTGWKKDTDRFSRIVRSLDEDDDGEEDSPALARARVRL